MTEIEPSAKPIQLNENVAPVEQPIQPGMMPAPYGIDATVAAGLEIRSRSQWDYARRRFFRHRLAMVGLIGLVIVFGAGIFANFVAPYSFSEIDLNNILAPPTTFLIDGRQYLAVHSGWGGDASGDQATLDRLFPGQYPPVPEGGTVWVFAIDGR